MTPADVLRIAQEAGFVLYDMHDVDGQDLGESVEADDLGALERFAALVAAHEREACAKVCDSEAARALAKWHNDTHGNQDFWSGAEQVVSGCADAIRARSAA